ncbi:MAG: DMT family transporter [Nitrosomonadales bacterium]|nr:DMT family transporter [Nitrosomonadales bacterium]
MRIATVYLLVTITTFFWGANFVLAAPVLANLPPMWAAAVRFLLGAALMFTIAGIRRDDLLVLLRRHAAAYLLLGTVGITAFNLLFFYAMQSSSANNAALIMAINPLLTALLAAAFLGEKPTVRHWLALPIALLVVVVVISQGNMDKFASMDFSHGDLLLLAATLSWALYNVLSRRYMPPGSAIANTSWILAVGASLLLATALASDSHIHALDLKASIAMAIMVVGGTVLAYLFWGIGIARLGAARTSIFLNLVPVFAMLIGSFLGTLPSVAQVAGGFLVLGGVTISMLPPRRIVAA